MMKVFTKVSGAILVTSLLCSTIPTMAIKRYAINGIAAKDAAKAVIVAKAAPSFFSKVVNAMPSWQATKIFAVNIANRGIDLAKQGAMLANGHRYIVGGAVLTGVVLCAGYACYKYFKARHKAVDTSVSAPKVVLHGDARTNGTNPATITAQTPNPALVVNQAPVSVTPAPHVQTPVVNPVIVNVQTPNRASVVSQAPVNVTPAPTVQTPVVNPVVVNVQTPNPAPVVNQAPVSVTPAPHVQTPAVNPVVVTAQTPAASQQPLPQAINFDTATEIRLKHYAAIYKARNPNVTFDEAYAHILQQQEDAWARAHQQAAH